MIEWCIKQKGLTIYHIPLSLKTIDLKERPI
jgi:hypothetical protein